MYTNHGMKTVILGLRASFNSWAAASYNTLDLIGNKLVCARVANDESGNFLVCQTTCKDTGNELHGE